MVLVDASLCGDDYWDLGELELLVRWGYQGDLCFGWVCVVVDALCCLFCCFEVALYFAINVRVRSGDWRCHADDH